jgi:hypothetical protein
VAYVRPGKRARQKRLRDAKREERERLIDMALGAVRLAMPEPGLCLPMCVFAARLLELAVQPPYTLKLGSLHVEPTEPDPIGPIYFDPRPGGIDDGFHAWLENANGELLDPSVLVTLAAEGYAVDPAGYILVGGRRFVLDGLRYEYEELGELELLGLEESEPHLTTLMNFVRYGRPPSPGVIYLDVGWRSGLPK